MSLVIVIVVVIVIVIIIVIVIVIGFSTVKHVRPGYLGFEFV